MITRADIENELAKYDTQEEQYRQLEIYLRSELPANPVVNGPLQQYINSEGISLVDIILENLPTYQNWVKYERSEAE